MVRVRKSVELANVVSPLAQSVWLPVIKKYFFTLSHFRVYSKKFNSEKEFKKAVKLYLAERNLMFDDKASSIELRVHLLILVQLAKELRLLENQAILL